MASQLIQLKRTNSDITSGTTAAETALAYGEPLYAKGSDTNSNYLVVGMDGTTKVKDLPVMKAVKKTVADNGVYFTSVEGKTDIYQPISDSETSINLQTTATAVIMSNGTTTVEEAVNKKADADTTTITLKAANWDETAKTQQVSVTGVTTGNVVIVSPDPSDDTGYTAYGKSLVKCKTQEAGKLTFSCEKIPESDIAVNIVIIDNVNK